MECLCTRYIVRGTCGTWYMVHGTWYVVRGSHSHSTYTMAAGRVRLFSVFQLGFCLSYKFRQYDLYHGYGIDSCAVGRSVRSIFIFTCLAAVVQFILHTSQVVADRSLPLPLSHAFHIPLRRLNYDFRSPMMLVGKIRTSQKLFVQKHIVLVFSGRA